MPFRTANVHPYSLDGAQISCCHWTDILQHSMQTRKLAEKVSLN